MAEQTFSIPAISCSHCVNAIRSELAQMEGVTSVEGDAAGKRIVVKWDSPATESAIRAQLEEMNYPAVRG
ncbi:MAG: heavy metal-associated domain-containing protein [Desulfobacterales bacterium]|jgi:copper chaperone CopZ